MEIIIQVVKFESALSEADVLRTANERADQFRALPGLIQKYYVKLDRPNHYGGVYLWDSIESLTAYRESDLAASIPKAYEIVGKPSMEILTTVLELR
jgi:heme-degrading monooxygenase HmoA